MLNPNPSQGPPYVKRIYWVLGFVILSAGWLSLWLGYFSSPTEKNSQTSELLATQASPQSHGPPSTAAREPGPGTTDGLREGSLSFDDQFRKESEIIGSVDPHPEESNRRLLKWAEKLNQDDLLRLKKKALDFELNGDQRALSVYLLGLSPRAEALAELGEIARSPVPNLPDDRSREFEMIYRAQAIEGLIRPSQPELSRQELQKTIAHVSDSALLDRSIRGLSYLNGSVPSSPKTQDEKALNKLLEH